MEYNEQDYPILYLYRDEVTDSGGAGTYRGGVGMHYTWKPHKTDQIQNVLGRCWRSCSTLTRYLGHPGTPIRPRVIRDSDVSERFADREMVESIDDLEGEVETLPTKAADVQKPDDIWEVRTAGSPGYGDPLLRDPADVAADVARGIVSKAAAYNIYGVVLEMDDSDVTVRESETVDRREGNTRSTPCK